MGLGDFLAGDTIDFKFTTTVAGVPTALSSGAISVYKDNSTTQSTTGVTLTASFDSVTGLNNVRITTASDGTFYANGSNFDVVVTTGTVGGVSAVGYVVESFSIGYRNKSVWAWVMTELSAVPTVTDTIGAAVMWVFLLARNKITQTATTQLLRNNADGATVGTSTVSDDGTTFTRGKFT